MFVLRSRLAAFIANCSSSLLLTSLAVFLPLLFFQLAAALTVAISMVMRPMDHLRMGRAKLVIDLVHFTCGVQMFLIVPSVYAASAHCVFCFCCM